MARYRIPQFAATIGLIAGLKTADAAGWFNAATNAEEQELQRAGGIPESFFTSAGAYWQQSADGSTYSLWMGAGAGTARVTFTTATGAVTFSGGVATFSSGLTSSGTFTASGTVSMSPANASVTMSPTGTGTVTIAPATAGTMNNCSVGATTRSTGAFTALALSRTDSTGTPGNVTNNSPLGRAAIAAAASSCVVTNSLVAATSEVFVNLISTDATLTSIRVTNIAAGSFTVTGNAAATAAANFSFVVVNA